MGTYKAIKIPETTTQGLEHVIKQFENTIKLYKTNIIQHNTSKLLKHTTTRLDNNI